MATFRTSATGGGSGGSGDRTVTITPSSGDHWTVGVCVSGNTNDAPTMSDNNPDGLGTYTLVAVVPKNGSADRVAVFVRDRLVTDVTSTTITAETGSNTAGQIIVVAYSSMPRAGSASIRQFASQSNQAAATTPAPAFSIAALTDNPTIGFVGNGTNPAGLTAPGSWTERQDAGQNNPPTGIEGVTRDSGFTGTTITWGSTSASAFGDIIVELDTSVVRVEHDQGAHPIPPPVAQKYEPLHLPEGAEDWPTPPFVFAPDEDYGGPPTIQSVPTVEQPIWDQDEIFEEETAVEDDGWMPPLLVPALSAPTAMIDDDAIELIPVDEESWAPQWMAPSPPSQPILEDTDMFEVAVTTVDEDGWMPPSWQPAAMRVGAHAPAVIDTDDLVPQQAAIVTDDDWMPPTAAPPLSVAHAITDADDAGSLTGTPDDDQIWHGWSPWPVVTKPPIEIEEDMFPTTTIDSDDPVPTPMMMPPVVYRMHPVSDEQFEVPQIEFDEEIPPLFIVWPPTRGKVFELEEDTLVVPDLTPDEDPWVPGRVGGIATWFVYFPPATDDITRQPVPPTPPRGRSGGYGPAYGSGGGATYLYEEYTYGEDDPDEKKDPVDSTTLQAMGGSPSPIPSATDMATMLGAGGAVYAGSKAITRLAEKHFGRHGGGIAAISSIVATAAATKKWSERDERAKDLEGPMIAGSVLAAIDDLVDIYVNERGGKPTLVPVKDVHEFLRKAQKHASLTVTSRTGTRRSTGERVVVLRYCALQKVPPRLYAYTEVIPLSRDGRFPIAGTLLEAIRRVQNSGSGL